MTTIDDLEAKAKAATPGPWTFSASGDLRAADGSVLMADHDRYDKTLPGERDAAFIATANPETVLKLVRVVRVAEAYRRFADESPYGSRGDDALNEALDALKEPSK